MKATFTTDSDFSYLCPIVHDFIFRELPMVEGKTDELLDLLTGIICGSRQFRLAAMPNPESLVLIRDVIRKAIADHQPIPILVPAGPKKNVADASVDLAELSALRILGCLQNKVRERFAPGLSIRIRLEDATGIYLEGEKALPAMHRYCSDFHRLVRILGYQDFMTPRMESEFVDPAKVRSFADELVPRFERVLDGRESPDTLAAIGWRSGMPDEKRKFFEDRYVKLYPHLTQQERWTLAAKYMAYAVARGKLGASGGDAEWQRNGGRIDICFAPPQPGDGGAASRVYYRTVPMSHSKLHVPFWRAKGFFKVDGETVRVGVMPWPRQTGGFIEGSLLMENEQDQIAVRADIQQIDTAE